MTSLDILYITLSISVLLIALSVSYVAISVIPTMKSLQNMISNFENIAEDVHAATSNMKNVNISTIKTIVKLVSWFKR